MDISETTADTAMLCSLNRKGQKRKVIPFSIEFF